MPNAFTPEGDGINDRVGPVFRCGSGTLRWGIYDRWGSLVFDTMQEASQWDGTIAGHDVPEGVYVWQAQLVGNAKDRSIYMGHITLMR